MTSAHEAVRLLDALGDPQGHGRVAHAFRLVRVDVEVDRRCGGCLVLDGFTVAVLSRCVGRLGELLGLPRSNQSPMVIAELERVEDFEDPIERC